MNNSATNSNANIGTHPTYFVCLLNQILCALRYNLYKKWVKPLEPYTEKYYQEVIKRENI